jgi:hypothetical protein
MRVLDALWINFLKLGRAIVNGTLSAGSIFTATAAGGDPGAGKINVTGISLNGVDLFALQADMEAATSNVLAATPGRMQYHPGVAKAWAKTVLNSGVPSLSRSYNISSVTDNGVGDFTYNFTTAFSDANYGYGGSCRDSSGKTRAISVNQSGAAAPTTTACRIVVVIDAGSGSGGPVDNDHSVFFFGDQ